MRRRLERRLDAYRDDAVSAGERGRLERRIAADPRAARRVREIELLGRAVRGAWTEGPNPPSPEYLIASLRPELRRIDADLAPEGGLGLLLGRLREGLLGFRPVPAAALGACAALLIFIAFPALFAPPEGVPLRETRLRNFALPEPEPAALLPIYDLAQEERPLMILEGEDGSTVIWILEDPEQLSSAPLVADGWA